MQFLRKDDGVVSVLLVLLLPLVLFAAGMAIDLTALNNQRTYVQGQADVGALSAASNFTSTAALRSAARRTVAQNPVYDVHPLRDSEIEIGTLVGGVFTAAANQNRLDGVTAVRVTVQSPVDLYILSMFASDDRAFVTRSAVAMVDNRVSFALTNCLLNVRLLAPVLRPIIGGAVDVLCSGRGVDTNLDLAQFLGGLNLRASALTPSGNMDSYGEILDAEYRVSDVMAQALGIPVINTGTPIRLGDVLIVPEDLRRVTVGAPIPPLTVGVADVVLASAALLQERIVDAAVAADLGPFGNLALKVTVSDPPRIVVGVRPGAPEAWAETAQIRVHVPDLNIAGIFSLQLALDVAHASARLTDRGQTCSTAPDATVAVFEPVTAGLLNIDLRVRVLGLPLNLAGPSSQSGSVLQTRRTSESFTYRQYLDRTPRRFGPTTPQAVNEVTAVVLAATSNALSNVNTALAPLGGGSARGGLLGGVVNVVLDPVTDVLSRLTSAITEVRAGSGIVGQMVEDVTRDILGLGIAQAELRLLDVDCGGRVRLGM